MHQTMEPPNRLSPEANGHSLITARRHLSPQEACGSWLEVNFQRRICCFCQKARLVKRGPESAKQWNPAGLSIRGRDRNPLGGMNHILGKKEEIRSFSTVTRSPLFPNYCCSPPCQLLHTRGGCFGIFVSPASLWLLGSSLGPT